MTPLPPVAPALLTYPLSLSPLSLTLSVSVPPLAFMPDVRHLFPLIVSVAVAVSAGVAVDVAGIS